jgi:hypothetical protein
MPIAMYDSVTVEAVPENPQAVAGYVDGWWPTYDPLVSRFPYAKHLSIAVHATDDAECLDIEQGDATPLQTPEWVRRQHARGIERPVVYCDLATAPEVLGVLERGGIGRAAVRLWTAHYNDRSHLCSPGCGLGLSTHADATQFTSRALSRNLDESLCADAFFPAPVDPHHYDRYPAERFAIGNLRLNERATVMEYDRLIRLGKADRARIRVLRSHIKLLRNRIWTVAHWDEPANWQYFRGWRWQRLNERLSGPVKL